MTKIRLQGGNVQKVFAPRTKHIPRLGRARFEGHDSGALGTRALALPFLLGFRARTNRDVDRRSEGHRKNVLFHVSDAKTQRKPLFSLL